MCTSGCEFATLQGAIDGSAPGDALLLAGETFAENVVITKDVTVAGNGAGNTVIDGSLSGTVVTVGPGVTATITDLTIRNGRAQNGGGVYNEGQLTLERVAVVDNAATDGGGGVFNNQGRLTVTDALIDGNAAMTTGTGVIGGGGIASYGTTASATINGTTISSNSAVTPGTDQRGGGGVAALYSDLTITDSAITDNDSGYSAGGLYVAGSTVQFSLTRSVVSGNRTGTDPARATGRGGGMSLRSSAVTVISESTISGNISASAGGGIHTAAPTTIVNSTVSGNQGASGGGGIQADVDVTLSSVTIANNTGNFGGGVLAAGQTIFAGNSIIADNSATTAGDDCYGTVSIAGGDVSLVERTDATICIAAASGVLITGVDPQLGPLADNGGPTLTQAPGQGSAVIDAGATDLASDQRGESRPSGLADDIGAVEIQVAPPPTGRLEVQPGWGSYDTPILIRGLPDSGSTCAWTPDETVDVLWDDPAVVLGSFTADADGCFEGLVRDTGERLAGSLPGNHKVTTASASGVVALATFVQVAEELHLNPVIGPPTLSVGVSGCGWGGASTVNLFWLDTGDPVGRAQVDASGCMDGVADIPRVTDGYYVIGASVGTTAPGGPGGSSAAIYQVVSASFSTTPSEAPAGERVSVEGCHWFPEEQVEFRWLSTGDLIATHDTGTSGCIVDTLDPDGPHLQIPTSATPGVHTIRALGVSSRQVAEQDFTVIDRSLVFDPPSAEPNATVAASGCGWTGNDSVTLEWGAVDPNNQHPSWLATVDPATGCFGEGGSFTFTVPDDTDAGDIEVTATGNDSGQLTRAFHVVHPGRISLSPDQGAIGTTLTAHVTDAIIGETVEFYWAYACSTCTPIAFGFAATPDFDVSITVPLNSVPGDQALIATGTKGFDDQATVFVPDTAAIEVTPSGPLYPAETITVEGSGFGAHEQVRLSLATPSDPGGRDLWYLSLPPDTTSFSIDVPLPTDLVPGDYDLVATGDRGYDASIPVSVNPLAFQASASYADPAPHLDGSLASGEWDLSARVVLPHGFMALRSDDSRLYLLLDLLQDDGNDALGSGDGFDVSFDTDGDGVLDPGQDLNFTLDAGGELILEDYDGIPRNSAFLTSTYGAAYGCAFQDGSRNLIALPPTCDRHRIWEIGIDLATIGAAPGDLVRMGVRTFSQSPAFDDQLPAGLSTDLRAYGTVMLAASILPSSPPDGAVNGIGQDGFEAEVTQAVQDANNSLPLVAHKDTVVRIYPDVAAESTVRVYLFGERGGVALPGSPLVTIATIPDPIDRLKLDDTANFLLPDAWTADGVTDLWVTAENLDGTNRSTPVHEPAVFYERSEFSVWVFPFNEGTTANPIVPSAADMADQEYYLERLLPIPNAAFSLRSWTEIPTTRQTAPAAEFENMKSTLRSYYALLEAANALSTSPIVELPDMFFGFSVSRDPKAVGTSDPIWLGGGARVVVGQADGSNFNTTTMVHEINHNLDLSSSGTWGRHVTDANPDPDFSDPNYGCGAGGPDPNWPTPGDDSINEIGFETSFPSEGRTVVPAWRDDYMSYCWINGLPVQWVSPYRWRNQFARFAPAVAAQSTQLTGLKTLATGETDAAEPAADGDAYYVSGRLYPDGTGELDPIQALPGTPTPIVAPGAYSLEVQDSAGGVLATLPFIGSFTGPEGEPLDHVSFQYVIGAQIGAARVVLKHGGLVLDEIVVSDNAPTLEVTAPTGGESWSGMETVRWQADDPDGDPLVFNVLYSPNGSVSWFPVASGLTDTSYELDTSRLPGGDEGKIRITASDGFNTVMADSAGSFTVPEPAATVTILSPGDGGVVPPSSWVELRGSATEAVGRTFAGDGLVWTLDGVPIGVGETLTAQLEDGPHELGLMAVDEDGVRGEATASILVAVAVPPEVTVSAASQTVEYSDGITPVTITATDTDSAQLTLSQLPSGILAEHVCEPVGDFGEACTWTITGTALATAGAYSITISDGIFTLTAHTLVIAPEAASVRFPGGNPVSVPVTEAGSDASVGFELEIRVTETTPDQAASGSAYPGDLGRAEPSLLLDSIADGGSVSPDACEIVRVDGTGYDAELTFRCGFANVPVGVYSIEAAVDGGYYRATSEDVLIVSDPSLGYTGGGGAFLWPGTGERTTFGYSMEYNRSGKKVQGSLMLVRHTADGERHVIKSNALYGLSIGRSPDSGAGYGWAGFSGKATYAPPGADPEGNHEFVVYVEDRGATGSPSDRFWIELRAKDGEVIAVMSMARDAESNAVDLLEGDVLVPR